MLVLFAAMGLVEGRAGGVSSDDPGARTSGEGVTMVSRPYYESLKNRPVALDLLRVLRTGKPANWGSQQDGKDWHLAMEPEDFAAQFTAAMDCRGVYLAQAVAKALDLSGRRRLLDIAGGSGVYACSFVTHHPHLAATVFESRRSTPSLRARSRSWLRRDGTVAAGDMLDGPSCRATVRAPLLQRPARLGRARGARSDRDVIRRAAARRPYRDSRRVSECREERAAACRRVPGPADALLRGPVLLDARDGAYLTDAGFRAPSTRIPLPPEAS